VPRTQRSAHLRGALQSRGPCIDAARGAWVPALRSSARALQRVRDTNRRHNGPQKKKPGRDCGRAFVV